MKKHKFFSTLGALCAALVMVLPVAQVSAAQTAQTPLPGSSIPQFVDPLPNLHTIIAGAGQIELDMTEFQSKVLPASFYTALPAPYNNGT